MTAPAAFSARSTFNWEPGSEGRRRCNHCASHCRDARRRRTISLPAGTTAAHGAAAPGSEPASVPGSCVVVAVFTPVSDSDSLSLTMDSSTHRASCPYRANRRRTEKQTLRYPVLSRSTPHPPCLRSPAQAATGDCLTRLQLFARAEVDEACLPRSARGGRCRATVLSFVVVVKTQCGFHAQHRHRSKHPWDECAHRVGARFRRRNTMPLHQHSRRNRFRLTVGAHPLTAWETFRKRVVVVFFRLGRSSQSWPARGVRPAECSLCLHSSKLCLHGIDIDSLRAAVAGLFTVAVSIQRRQRKKAAERIH